MVLSPWMSAASGLLGFVAVMAWRVQEGRSPVTLRKIVIPPLGMSTGLCMFLVPACRVPWLWAAGVFLLGALVLAWPLVRTSRLTMMGDTVMVHRSKSFFAVLVSLAVLRIAAHSYLDRLISLQQTAALFYLLAFGMVLRWRTSMLREYRRVVAAHPTVLP